MPGRSRGRYSTDLVDSLGLRQPLAQRSKRCRESAPQNRRVCVPRSNSRDESWMNPSSEVGPFAARRTFSATFAGSYAIFTESPSMYFSSTDVIA